MATIAAAKKFLGFRLDGHGHLCNNRTNVRRMRGHEQVKRERLEKWARTATDKELEEALELLKACRAAASLKERSLDLQATEHQKQS